MVKKRILVSACLLGFNCNYKGSCANEYSHNPIFWNNVIASYEIIPICPEQQGGLPTPRIPSELLGPSEAVLASEAKVISKEGADVTDNFVKGAQEALRMAKLAKVSFAVLKSRSPSCGKGQIYDGTFTGVLIDGSGITVALLEKEGVPVFSEKEFMEMAK